MQNLTTFFGILVALFSASLTYAASITSMPITSGNITDIGLLDVLTDFGMLTGSINFHLGSFVWPPKEIWLIPSEIDPDIFNSGLTQLTVLEIPQNITFSTCRTAVYLNESVGYGFKIYNTAAKTQIFPNGTFCGLAYNGTYFVYAKF